MAYTIKIMDKGEKPYLYHIGNEVAKFATEDEARKEAAMQAEKEKELFGNITTIRTVVEVD